MVKTEHENTSIDKETLLEMYHKIRTIRRFGEVGIEMYRNGYIRGYFHPYIGEEAIAVGACQTIRKDDYIVSNHRGYGHFIAKGTDLKLIMAELFGRKSGCSMGRGGSMHIVDISSGNIGGNGIVGAGIPIAVGIGMGIKQEKTNRVVICFLGDGATNNGVFAESLNLASIYKLPVIFIIENNHYAGTTRVSQTALCENLSDRGTGYCIEGKSISGNDPVEVMDAVRPAVEKARRGEGPSLIEAKTYRHYGHHINDPGNYMPKEEIEKWKALDPVDIALKYLKKINTDESIINRINDEIEREIKSAVTFAKNSPEPDIDEFFEDIKIYDN